MTTRQVTTATVSIAELRDVVRVAVERHPEARSRIEAAASIVLLRSISPDPEYVACFTVESESEPGRFHSVDHGVGVCDCADYQRRGLRCKHLWSVRILAALARLHGRQAVAVAA